MSNPGHEARINDALKQLGEEFRLGMVQVAEYRSRRKMLVDSWGELEATTAPRSLQSRTTTAPVTRARGTAPAPAATKKSPMPIVIAAIATVALGVGAWLVLRPSANPHPAPVPQGPAAVPLSAAAAATSKAADEFLARNSWDAASIQSFLAQWQALSPAERERLVDEPSLRSLRSRLDQNIQAEMQLITTDTKPEERAQLTLLQDFSRALTGASP